MGEAGGGGKERESEGSGWERGEEIRGIAFSRLFYRVLSYRMCSL